MLPDTVCHLVTDNSRVVRDGVTNNFYQRGAETAMPTLPVRLILSCLNTNEASLIFTFKTLLRHYVKWGLTHGK